MRAALGSFGTPLPKNRVYRVPVLLRVTSLCCLSGRSTRNLTCCREVAHRRNAHISLDQIDALPAETVNSLYVDSLRERAKRLNQAAHGQEQQNAQQALLRVKQEFERRG